MMQACSTYEKCLGAFNIAQLCLNNRLDMKLPTIWVSLHFCKKKKKNEAMYFWSVIEK